MEGTFELGCRGCWTVGLGWAVLFVVVLVGLVADMAEIEVVVRIEGAVRIEDTAGVVNMVVEVAGVRQSSISCYGLWLSILIRTGWSWLRRTILSIW